MNVKCILRLKPIKTGRFTYSYHDSETENFLSNIVFFSYFDGAASEILHQCRCQRILTSTTEPKKNCHIILYFWAFEVETLTKLLNIPYDFPLHLNQGILSAQTGL